MKRNYRGMERQVLRWIGLIGACAVTGVSASLAAPTGRTARPTHGAVRHNAGSAKSRAGIDLSLQRAFEQAVYRPDRSRNGAVTLDNPAQQVSADLTPKGIEVHVARNRAATLTLTEIERGGHRWKVPPARPQIAGDRVTVPHGALTEWFLNRPSGIEQGFTLRARPEGGRAHRLTLRLKTGGAVRARAGSDGKSVRLVADGVSLVYRGLAAQDARHRSLPCRMSAAGDEILLQVDDRSAAYPIVIDPVLQQALLASGDSFAGDWFGQSVSLYGDRAVIGAPMPFTGQGAVYVFTRNGAVWTEQAKLTPPDSSISYFGYSVSTHDCVYPGGIEPTIAVGAPADGTGAAGAVCTYTYASGAWINEHTLRSGVANDRFGQSVSLDSVDLFVGAPNAGGGAAYIYLLNSGLFSLYQTLVPPGSNSYSFAESLSEANGVLALNDSVTGGVDVYTIDFASGAWTRKQTLTDPTYDPNSVFGNAIEVDPFSDNIMVGAYFTNNGDGAAYLFKYLGNNTWNAPIAFTPPVPGQQGWYGWSVASEGGQVFIGAPYDDSGPQAPAGAVYSYLIKPDGSYGQNEVLYGTDPAWHGVFGYSISLYNGTLMVGEPSGGEGGLAFAFAPAPVIQAVDDSYQMAENTTLTVDAAHGVLTNDTNLGSGPFTARLYTSTGSGQLTLGTDGSFTYTPNYGFVGTDTFQYVAHNDQGDSNVATVTLAVSLPSVINVPNVTGNEGGSVTVKATLGKGTYFNSHSVISGANLTFWVNNQQIGAGTTDRNGNVSVSYTPPAPGITAVSVQFAGNKSYAPSTGLGAIIVRYKTAMSFQPDYAIVGQGALPTGTIQATYIPSVLVGVKVSLYQGSTRVGATTSDANGYVVFNLGTQSHAGTFNYTAVYVGDGYNQPCSAPVTLTVSAAGTALTLSNASGSVGHPVTLKANLTDQVRLKGLAGMSVAFSLNGNVIGTAVTATSGVATLVYTIPAGTALGRDSLSASFAGTTDYSGSTSNAATLKVSSATSVSVSNVSGSAGQKVSLSAQLLTSPGSAGVSGETLSFTVDGKAAGNATTDASGTGSVSYTISGKAASGNHAIKVTHQATTYLGASTGAGILTVH